MNKHDGYDIWQMRMAAVGQQVIVLEGMAKLVGANYQYKRMYYGKTCCSGYIRVGYFEGDHIDWTGWAKVKLYRDGSFEYNY